MFNVRLAGYHLYGKWLCIWLLLVMSLMRSYFCVVLFFPRDALDEMWVVAPVFQWYCFTPCGSPGVTIRFCRVLISDSS